MAPSSYGAPARHLVHEVRHPDALAGAMAEDEEDQVLRDWLQLQPGGILGSGDRRFEVGKQIGRGGMGVVYEARWQGTTRRAAVKVVFRIKVGDAGLGQLLEEVKTTQHLESDHVPHIHAHGLEPDFAWFAMDYLEGGTLHQRIQNDAPLSWEQTCRICRDILQGLRDAHAAGRVHGDLKPGNVMAVKDGSRWKVLDWGLARAACPSDGAAVTDCVSGTPMYLAPECWKDRARYSAWSDFYALGVMMVEMLTRTNPFAGIPEVRLEAAHERGRLAEVAGLPDEARRIVARATAQQPDDRYSNANEFLADLDTSGVDRFRLRRTWPWLALAGVVLLALALWAFYPRSAPPARYQGALTLWLAGHDKELLPDVRAIGGPSTLPLRAGDRIVLQARLQQGPAAHFYVIWIDSEGKAKRLYPEGWTDSTLSPSDEKQQDFRWPGQGGSAALAKSPDGFESVLWLVRDRPLSRQDNAQLTALLVALPWKQPAEWKGKEIAIWWEDGLRSQARGAPDPRTIHVADDPITQTEKLLRTLKERGLASYSRAMGYSFVGE
jgi:hypothetical protein